MLTTIRKVAEHYSHIASDVNRIYIRLQICHIVTLIKMQHYMKNTDECEKLYNVS